MDIALLASYCGSSIAMTVVNAAVARDAASSSSSSPIGILFFQTCVAAVVMYMMPVVVHDARRRMPSWWALAASLLSCCMLVSSMLSLVTLPIGTVSILRNLGSVVSLMVEYLCLNGGMSLRLLASTLTIVVGTILWGAMDGGGGVGVQWVIVNVSAQVLQGICVKKAFQKQPITPLQLSFENNAVSALVFGLLGGANAVVPPTPLIVTSCLIGAALNFSGMILRKSTSATSFLVINNACKVGVVLAGVLVFGEGKGTTAVQWAGAAISFGGVAWYGYLKI